MIQTLINAWKVADLRKKILYTAFIILVFRIGAAIPVPFVEISDGLITDVNANNFMTYLSMMTGDAFNYGTLFAMSITPYINASIIIQLLTVAIPALEKLAKEGGYIYVFEKASMLYVDETQSVDLTPAARKALNIPDGRTLETLQQELQAQSQKQ